MSEKELDFSKSEIENFVNNRIWRALVQDIIGWTNDKMVDNNVVDPFKEPTRIARNQGYVEALSGIVDYPAILLEQVEFNEKKEEK